MADIPAKTTDEFIELDVKGDISHAEVSSEDEGSGRVFSVENPLRHLTEEQLEANVNQFVVETGLVEHKDLFKKAAFVAQDPNGYHLRGDLSVEEKDALDYESKHKWSGTWDLYFAIIMCAMGAATQGWDQTGSNGANLSFPQEFGVAASPSSPNAERDEWIVGFINSAPYLSAALAGCWLSDPLNKYLGRRGEIFLTALILMATPIASGFTKTWQELLIVRLILGLGLGAKAATVPIYAAELAPARIRGALVMGWQLWVCFGIFLGFAANVVVKDVGKIAWRLQLASAFLPALPLAIGIYFAPESPRWYMKKGRYVQAFKSMLRIRKHPLLAARDLYYSHVLFMEEQAKANGASYLRRLSDCFTVPRIRRGTLGASVVMLAQQMCGINIISFYSSTVFAQSGYTVDQALYASLGFGAVNFVFAIPAIFTIDTFGRRSLLLATFPFMALTLLATGLSFLMDEAKKVARTGLIAFFIYLFTAFYSVGEGPVAFLYSAEVFPLVQREQGMAWAVAVNNFFAAALGLTFPRMLRAFGSLGSFCFYAGLNVIALIWIFLFVPETKALTLEELDQVFSFPTTRFIRYQTTEWLPYMIKRYAFRDTNAAVRPLYGKSMGVNGVA